jgi:hypothetical protein
LPIRARLFSPAVGISDTLQDYFAKLGNVDFIVKEGKRTDFYGHSCFASNPRVGADLVKLIRNGTPPRAPGRPLLGSDKSNSVLPDH